MRAASTEATFPAEAFEVGKGQTIKHVRIDPGDEVPPSKMLERACLTRGVKRVYWLCCTQLGNQAPMYELP